MAIDPSNLPRDNNGIVQGVWRVLHQQQTYNGSLGLLEISHGVATTPVCGRTLQRLAAIFGAQVYIEPWEGRVPDGFVPQPLIEWHVPASMNWTPEPCPWRKPAAAAPIPAAIAPPAPAPQPAAPVDSASVSDDDLHAMTRPELEALAESLGVELDRRWGDKTLRRHIRSARA